MVSHQPRRFNRNWLLPPFSLSFWCAILTENPPIFLRHYPAFKNGQLNVSELARVCDLSRTTVYKYIGILQIKKQPFGCFFGADDGTFVAARCSFGLFRWAEKPSAPRLLLLPTKPAALWGLLFSWVQVRIMQKKHLSLRGAFLVRMMGLEPTGYCYH